jgi:hypothetical protein
MLCAVPPRSRTTAPRASDIPGDGFAGKITRQARDFPGCESPTDRRTVMGCPSTAGLWRDLRQVTSEIRPGWDLSGPRTALGLDLR